MTASAVSTGGGVRVNLLRGFELSCGGDAVALPPSASRLIAFLALHPSTLSREFVAGKLWIDCSEERAGANLRSALWRVRTSGHPVVEATRVQVRLAPDVAVDIAEVAARCQILLAGGNGSSESDLAAADLEWELLPDWYEEWVFFERERLRQLCLHALEALADRHTQEGRHAEAVDAALAAVRFEPLRESAWRTVIRAHLGEGNRTEAIRQYMAYRRLLHEELGLPPSDQMERMMDGVRAPSRRRAGPSSDRARYFEGGSAYRWSDG